MYITIKIADDKVEEFLNHKDDDELVMNIDKDYFVFEMVKVERELTDKEQILKDNHALRRAWKQG